MQKLEIIVGVSHFSGGPIVGIALPKDQNGNGCTKWADSLGCGRPATVEPRNGRNTTEEAEIKYLADRWDEWAARNNIQIQIKRTPRRVAKPF